MKLMHRILVCLTVFSLVLTLCACGGNNRPTVPPTDPPTVPPTEPPITADTVYADVADAMSEAKPTRLKMAFSYEVTVTEGEGETATVSAMSMSTTVDTMVCEDPFGSYTLMDMAMDSDGFGMNYTIEAYIVEEDGSVVTYMQMFDTWTRVDYEMSVSDFLDSGEMTEITTDDVWSGNPLTDLVLDENTDTVNGKEVYILRASIPAGDMSTAFSDLGVEDPSVYEDMTLPVVYYVDVQTSAILRMEVSMSFMVDILDEIIAQSLVGAEVEDADIELTISDMVYDLEYEVPQIPAVPQEAYDYIANNPDTSGGEEPEPTVYDGPLVLNCGSEQLLLTCPEGFMGDYYDETNIMLYNEDYSLCGDYYFWESMTREEVLNLADINAGFLEGEGILVSQGDGPEIEGYETWQVIGDDQSYYYAWREAGDGWLLVAVYDYSGIDNASVLLPQFLSCISLYTE